MNYLLQVLKEITINLLSKSVDLKFTPVVEGKLSEMEYFLEYIL